LSLIAFATQSRQGDARAPGVLARILMAHHLPATFACAEQVHSSRIQIVRKLAKSRRFPAVDGFLTEVPAQPLAIFTADCVPIFLSADGARVVGLLHAGWRGVRKLILPRAIRIIKQKWGIQPSDVQAWSGPHIGPCCFEVQWDVARFFPATRLRRGSGGQARWTIDLEKELRKQAKQLGVRWLVPRSLGGGGVSKKAFKGCTMHEARFFSYRRDKTPKRQVSVIMKRKTR
jgi:YfiH family protein